MICLFGGTFDPVHHGHLHAARTVCDALRLNEIRMLLSARPGHRAEPGASVEHRWRMLELACAEDPRLVPDDTEVQRARRLGRPSYAVETLEALRAEAPDAVVCWVLGSDAYRQLETWHRWREMFELANLVVLRRPGTPLQLPAELERITTERRCRDVPREPAGRVLVLEAPMKAISATEVRRILASAGAAGTAAGPAAGARIADLLPPAVYTYITKYHLYGVVSDA